MMGSIQKSVACLHNLELISNVQYVLVHIECVDQQLIITSSSYLYNTLVKLVNGPGQPGDRLRLSTVAMGLAGFPDNSIGIAEMCRITDGRFLYRHPIALLI